MCWRSESAAPRSAAPPFCLDEEPLFPISGVRSLFCVLLEADRGRIQGVQVAKTSRRGNVIEVGQDSDVSGTRTESDRNACPLSGYVRMVSPSLLQKAVRCLYSYRRKQGARQGNWVAENDQVS